MPAVAAIIGRPNVGKSTLFNRIIGRRIAIESPVSGTTRDPVSARYEGDSVDILFVDTGGLQFGEEESGIEEDVQSQARIAIEEADIILFCLDTKRELTSGDEAVVDLLRKRSGKKPIFLIGTKYDGKIHGTTPEEIMSLAIGEGDPYLVSAIHNSGLAKLVNAVERELFQRGFRKDPERDEDEISIAIIGRPNVGKSSIVNAITKSNLRIVSEVAGTTRDTTDIPITKDGKKYRLIDTAGLRRKSKIEEDLESLAIMRALTSLQRADVALLLIDATEGVTHQDKHIIEHVLESNTGLILGVNKWDLQEKGEEEQKKFLANMRYELPFVPWAPVLFLSALEGKNIPKLFPLTDEIAGFRRMRIPTAEFNIFLQEMQGLHPLSGTKNAHPRVKYGTQVQVSPPKFVFSGSQLDRLHFSSRRYIENRMRDAFGFNGTPIIMEFVTQKNPYLTGKKKRTSSRDRKERRPSK